MQWLDQLIKRWRAEPVELLPGERAEAVIAAFQTFGVHPTDDVIALYGRIGGMTVMDSAYWRLWPLAEIASGDQQNAAERGVVFSDYCISCWEYRLKPNVSGGSAVYLEEYDARAPSLVAPSLEAFFAMYVANADALLCQGA